MKQVFINKNDTYLKGNLHTHTNASDGRYPVSDVARIYKEKGYDFLGISDHDVYFDKEIENEDLLILHGEEVSCNYVGNDFYKAAYAHFCCFLKTRQVENSFSYETAEDLADCIERSETVIISCSSITRCFPDSVMRRCCRSAVITPWRSTTTRIIIKKRV